MRAILLGVQGFWTELYLNDYPRTIEIPCLVPYRMDMEEALDRPVPLPTPRLRFVRIAVSDEIYTGGRAPAVVVVYEQVPDGIGKEKP